MERIKDTYAYNSVSLARYIVAYANAHGFGINITKVQKLLYIAYGTYLAVRGARLTDEHPQAWPFGPVFPTTRRKLLGIPLGDIRMADEAALGDEAKSLVALVFRSFGARTASYLTAWSHQPGSPWDFATKMDGFKWGDEIPDEYILPYFDGMVKYGENGGQ